MKKLTTYFVSYVWEDWCNGAWQHNNFDSIIIKMEKFKFYKVIRRIEKKHCEKINGEKYFSVHGEMIKIISITNMDK